VISSTKKVFKKAPARAAKYRQMLAATPLPPEPVLTRWTTWLRAVKFYNQHFEAVKSVWLKILSIYQSLRLLKVLIRTMQHVLVIRKMLSKIHMFLNK